MQPQTEAGFAFNLATYLNTDEADGLFESGGIDHARPYDELGMLTRNAGLVVRMKDGTEFQITVVRSRGPRS